METRRLPVRPNLDQLRHQAKDLLRELQASNPAAKLADAQLALARSYQASSWPRLVQACQLADAIWEDDLDTVRELVTNNPKLLHEDVLIRKDSNWGPPLTYAANLGRNEIIRWLHQRGATDLKSAVGRAVLQGKALTVKLVHELAGRPPLDRSSLAGPAYTLSVEGTAIVFALGARLDPPNDGDANTFEHLFGTDARVPARKHRILELYVEHGFEPPDTAIMALHRGRIDLLEQHLARDPGLLTRTFDKTAIYPLAPQCHGDPYVAQGTPVHGGTLLHIAAYFDEVEIGEWLLDQGMDVNVRCAVDADGIGGYTALFNTVVSQRNFWVNYGKREPDEARFTRLLLERGADPNARASLRHRREEGHGGGPIHESRDVTPIGWGERFHDKIFVSQESLRLVEARGGGR